MSASSNNQTSYSSNAGWNHNVVLTGLQYNTTYYYICGDPSYALSQQFQFTTERDNFSATTIAVYGDLGTNNSQDTINLLNQRATSDRYGLFVHCGDISYANDHPLRYEDTWNSWFSSMQPAMARIPYMVAPGNHESWCRNPLCASQTANFTTFKEKFRMPGNESGSTTNMFYSFDYYNIHFIAIDTENDYPGSPPIDPSPSPKQLQQYYLQANWLTQDLTAAVANRKNVPWIIMFGHRPIYSPTEQNNGVPNGYAASVQAFFEPYMKNYSVDLYLSGHVHSYARTYPVYNNVVTSKSFTSPPSTVHLFAGGPGNPEGLSTWGTPEPSWYAAGNDQVWGFGELVVNNQTSLTWNYYQSNTGNIIDTFTITKN